MSVALVIMAKTPTPGRSKTRLCPPCTPCEAALLAEAALCDTIDVVRSAGADRPVLAMDVLSPEWSYPGFELIEQRGDGLAERLRAVVHDVAGPVVIVGMDTPQVTSEQLAAALAATGEGATAQLGLASDGGWWAIGLPTPCPQVFDGVPMSSSGTGRLQLGALRSHFGSVQLLPTLRDVDYWSDALDVAHDAPDTRFAREVHRIAGQSAGDTP